MKKLSEMKTERKRSETRRNQIRSGRNLESEEKKHQTVLRTIR